MTKFAVHVEKGSSRAFHGSRIVEAETPQEAAAKVEAQGEKVIRVLTVPGQAA